MTEATTIPSREEIAPEHRWNAESVFASTAEWQETYDRTLQDIEKASASRRPAVLPSGTTVR